LGDLGEGHDLVLDGLLIGRDADVQGGALQAGSPSLLKLADSLTLIGGWSSWGLVMPDQDPPKGDRRYRTHRSVKCYVAELHVGTGGATWYFNDSIERVVHRFPNGEEKVVYRDSYYPLQPANRMIEIAHDQFASNGALIVGGRAIHPGDADMSFQPYEFIDITTADEHERARKIFAERP
jgi:hypothetical protein